MGLLKRTMDSFADLDISLKAHSQVVETRGMPVKSKTVLIKEQAKGQK